MVRIKSKEKSDAIKLRKQGKTYSEILRVVPVAKSTISLWLREVGLAKKQKQLITAKRIAGQLRAIEVIKRNKIKRVKDIKSLAREEVPKLIKDPFWLTGVLLYWGEGSKEHEHACPVKFTNMDLNMHRIFLKWMLRYLPISKSDLAFELFIHERADVEGAKNYWSKELSFSKKVLKVYFKKHNPKTKRKRIGDSYFGVLSVQARGSIALNRKIAGWVDGIVVYLSRI